jgi:hypothetical protein
VAILFEKGHTLGEFFTLQNNESGQLGGNRRWGADFVHDETQGRGVDEIEHVIEGGRQAVDILAIEGSDEALVEFGDDGVGGFITSVLYGLHLIDPHGKVAGIGEYAPKQFGSIGDIAGKFSEKVEKLGVAGD